MTQIMGGLDLLGAAVEHGGFGDEQAMRIAMLVALLGRRVSEICLLDRDPLLPLLPAAAAGQPDAAGESDAQAPVAKLRYQQTKIDGAPNTILVHAEVVAIIREQQQWAQRYFAEHSAPGTTPKYLFLATKMNRNGDRPYTDRTLRSLLTELAARLDVRDSTGAVVDFHRTHRFRHTVATNLLNTGVPLHVLQRYLGHLTPTMSMTYAQTLQSTAEREFLRYRKITADARDLEIDPHDLYDMLALDRRTDRILPNGWCLLPPRQSCNKGNACLTCDKFATDATFLPELRTQRARTGQLIDERRTAFEARTGQPMSEDNIWLAGRRQEHDALGRVILKLEHTQPADGTVASPARRRRRRPHRCHHQRTEPEVTGMRGNPDNLRRAAARKSAAAQARAEHGLREMIRANEQITFRGLAQTAGVSLDFLYRCAPIRQRVEHLRAQQQNTPPPEATTTHEDAPSSVVRTLTSQLSALKQRHRDEVHQLRQALEAAQGEILELRRRLGHRRDIEPPHPAETDIPRHH